eukprot:TRINITY_DN533_c0_g1_i1.p1 TRINITY_DN533_c0_g1~~TRINITY_DN533_c0_g1_i1.p1  ORF type:complete len:270 (-),score=74.27 TRINITY_DN533_c0_g1_i1:73-882(-)
MTDLADGSALQPFCLLAKNAKGKAAQALIEQALNAPHVYVFGELLDMANIQQLEGTDSKQWLDLLKIFAYGTLPNYRENQSLPQLTPNMLSKLRQLTLVSLSTECKVIPYTILLQQLEITNLRALEDLIIESIYQGVIRGKLDQRCQQLEVDFAIGRDIRPGQVEEMIKILAAWAKRSDSLLATINDKMSFASHAHDLALREAQEFEQKIEAVKATIKAAGNDTDLIMHHGGIPSSMDDYNQDFNDERSRKRGQKVKGREQHSRDRRII